MMMMMSWIIYPNSMFLFFGSVINYIPNSPLLRYSREKGALFHTFLPRLPRVSTFMASSSSSNMSCVQCHDSSSDCLNNGWKFRSGEHAQLCNRCFALYGMGLFCEAFHSDDHGWRGCEYCRKVVHCGCIVSLDEYSELDTNGVVCMACSRGLLRYLFEKVVTASDTDSRLTRIVIAKKYAEAYFPEITDPLGIPLSVMDAAGNEYNLIFRYWPHLESRIYVLKGLKRFMNLYNLQAGDRVAFFSRVSDKKIVMEVRKKPVRV